MLENRESEGEEAEREDGLTDCEKEFGFFSHCSVKPLSSLGKEFFSFDFALKS